MDAVFCRRGEISQGLAVVAEPRLQPLFATLAYWCLRTDGWLGLGCISLERAPRTWLGPWDLTSAGKLPRGLFSSTKDHAIFQLVLYGWNNPKMGGSNE